MSPIQALRSRTSAPGYWTLLGERAAESLESIASMAAHWFHAPTAVVWLAQDHPSWLRSWYGLAGGWSRDELAILAEALPTDQASAIGDAANDARFLYSVLVSGPRALRFCASAPLTDEDGNCLGVIMVASNRARGVRHSRVEGLAAMASIAAQAIRQWEAAGAAAESRFYDPAETQAGGTLFEHAADFVFTHDLRGRLTSVNRAAEDLTGYRREDLLSMDFEDLLDGNSRETASRMVLMQYGGGPASTVELALRTRDGGKIDVEVRVYVLFERGLPGGVMGFVRPVSREPIDLRSHDAVTGLLNARGLTQQLQRQLDLCRESHDALAVLLIEVTGLQLVNQALGYEAGDTLIEGLATRFRACLAGDRWLGRLSGNRFVVVQGGAVEKGDVESLAAGLLEQTAAAFPLDGNELFLTASIGISRFPEDGDDALTLMRNAEGALAGAVRQGGGALSFYSPELQGGAVHRLELTTSLHRAIENRELRQLYQPQSDALGRLARFEALLAWDHPQLGRLAAQEFISVAEESGLIARIDFWVLAEASRRCRSWQQQGHAHARISVNVSGAEFERPDFVDLVIESLAASGLDPQRLELEITEGVLVRDFKHSALRIDRLRALGIALAIDDFGTGYSSLSYLRMLRVDAVKIDQSFVDGIDQPAGNLGLVESIIRMVHGLGLDVVAEGVETLSQWDTLRRAGCDRMQGHFLGAALEEEAALRLLESNHPFPIG